MSNRAPKKFYRQSAWLDPRLEIRPSPLGGKGTFAREPISQNEIVTIWGAEVFTKEEVNEGKAEGREIIPIAEDLYLAYEPDDYEAPDHFLNHSCDPNVWMADEVSLIARRDIRAGEELTTDYAMFETNENWVAQWQCNCGSSLCRKTFTGKDWRLPELQDRYRDHFLPCLNERIKKLNKEIVRSGYDKVSYAYRSDAFDYENSEYKMFLSWLESRLNSGATVLDLGCGCGIPIAQVLSRRHIIIGVDISAVQIERARQSVPQAQFICADMTTLDFEADTFDTVIALYSIIHVPLEEQPALVAKIVRWLKPQGYLLASVGHTAWAGTETNWCEVEGATMYWSHSDKDTYRRLLEEVGIVILQEGFVHEDGGGHPILLGQKRNETNVP